MRDIKGYEGKYAITEDGKVWSYRSKMFLKPVPDRDGYLQVGLKDLNKHYRLLKIHRLVAMTYIPNPDNLPQVNHKDEVHDNNHVSNLEWCTGKYNCNYGTRNQRIKQIKQRRLIANVQD